jgi:putative addiction module CopG family antidote
MPTRNISLTPQQDAFIDEMLKAGVYRNASEAMRNAIRALQQRHAEEALKLDNLRLCCSKASRRSTAASSPRSRTRAWTPILTSLPRTVDPLWRQ